MTLKVSNCLSENLTNTTLNRNRTLKYSQSLVCPQHKIRMRLIHLGILCWNTWLNTENLRGFDIVSSAKGYNMRCTCSYAMKCIFYLLLSILNVYLSLEKNNVDFTVKSQQWKFSQSYVFLHIGKKWNSVTYSFSLVVWAHSKRDINTIAIMLFKKDYAKQNVSEMWCYRCKYNVQNNLKYP